MLRRDLRRRQHASLAFCFSVTVFVGAGVIVGGASGDQGSKDPPVDDVLYMLLNLLGAASMLGTFANNKLIFWREMSAGYSKEAFFLSQNLLDIPQFVFYVLGEIVCCRNRRVRH